MSDFYAERLERCEEHRKLAHKINKIFKLTLYFSVIPTVISLLITAAFNMAGFITIGTASSPGIFRLLFSAICGLGIIFIGSLAADEKTKRLILYEVAAIVLKMLFDGAAIFTLTGIIAAVMWLLCLRMCNDWDYLKHQEGFPSFDSFTVQNEKSVANTRGLGVSAVKEPKEEVPAGSAGYMEDISENPQTVSSEMVWDIGGDEEREDVLPSPPKPERAGRNDISDTDLFD